MGRVANILPTSFSALNSFETCPRRHYLTRISKRVVEPPSAEINWGNFVHKALEKYLRDGTPLPKSVRQYQKYADKIKAAHPDANLLVEQQLSVDKNFQPVGWWDKRGWFRGVIDVALLSGNKAYVFDWKTGNQKDDFDQLAMFAALITSHHPDIEVIHSGFIWLKTHDLTNHTYERDDARKFWANVSPRVKRLQEAHKQQVWPARPSGLCKKWCPVGRVNCEHCGG